MDARCVKANIVVVFSQWLSLTISKSRKQTINELIFLMNTRAHQAD